MEQMHWVAAGLFALALIHTFSTRFFERLAHRQPQHAGLWHLLGEVEIVFGVWACALIAAMAVLLDSTRALAYLDSRNFTEPMFVFAILVIAGSRPVLRVTGQFVEVAQRILPGRGAVPFYFVVLGLVPLLGSLITEPAAMTLAALMLRERVLAAEVSDRLKYATVGVLFVNISIGGTLTPFAAPPVLMVAQTWQWDLAFMMSEFGPRAAVAVLINALGVTWLFSRELAQLPGTGGAVQSPVPASLVLVHVALLAGVVVLAHHPAGFLGLLLMFLGIATAYPQHQDRLMLREGLLVAFFLAGLVVLGGLQRWWLEPLLMGLDATAVFYGALVLTAFTDNAALTYLGSQVQGLSDPFKFSLVSGAVVGGGLTVIANAPNPAGFAILRVRFADHSIQPLRLLLAALVPTAVAVVAFRIGA